MSAGHGGDGDGSEIDVRYPRGLGVKGLSCYTQSEKRKEETTMVDVAGPNIRALFLDKKPIQKIVVEQNERMGFVPDPTATAEKAQAMTLALGIRPEDNLLSRGIIAARDE